MIDMPLPAELLFLHYLLFYRNFSYAPYSFFHPHSISRSLMAVFLQPQADSKQQYHLIFYILPVFLRLSPTPHVLWFCPTPTCTIASDRFFKATTQLL